VKLIPLGEPALDAIRGYGSRVPERLRGDVFSLDTETTGLDPYTGARIFCYSLFSNKGEKLWLPKTPRTTQWIMDLLNDPEKVVVTQNGKYDFKMLTFENWSVDDLRAEFHDTLAMGVILDEYSPHDLGYMVRQHLGIDIGTKTTCEDWLKANHRAFSKAHERPPNFSDIPLEILVPYAEWDAEHTLKLAYYFKSPIKAHHWPLYRMECRLILCTIEMELRGLMIDLKKTERMRDETVVDIEWIEQRLRDVVGRDFIIHGSGSKKDTLKAITEDLEWEIKAVTPKGNPKLDEYGLLSYLDPELAHIVREDSEKLPVQEYIKKFKKASRDPRQLFVPLMLKWRELSKMVNTYYEPFMAKAVDGVIHGRFNSLTAITGRFSSSNPNLQNIPRILGPRQCFRARPGFINLHADYSQVEMRLFIHYARDAKLKQALVDGKDLHLQTATEIFQKPEGEVTKEERKKAKSTNFGILYGSGAETLAETLTKMGIPTSPSEGKAYLERYHRAKPSVRRIMSKCKAELARRGFVEDEFGRRYRVPMRMSYKALNALIQGCSAGIMKRAMVRIWRYLKAHKCRSQLILTIHDEVVPEIHMSELWLIPVIKELMEKDNPLFWVPITSDLEYTDTYWADKRSLTKMPTEMKEEILRQIRQKFGRKNPYFASMDLVLYEKEQTS
jgi:DNA polymerase-1